MNFRYKTFHDGDLITEINPKKNIFKDMGEFIGENTFQTIQNLSKIFNFPSQKKSQKDFFKVRVSKYEGILPLILKLDEIKTTLFITTKHWLPNGNMPLAYEVAARYKSAIPQRVIDISGILDNPHEEIIIATTKQGFEKLSKDKYLFARIKVFLESLIMAVLEQKKREDSKILNEDLILEYFKKNKALAKRSDEIFNRHLKVLCQNAPHIIESWGYYQKFKELV